MFCLICARLNGWVNNGEAGDLRRHRDDYDATVMSFETNTVLYIIPSKENLNIFCDLQINLLSPSPDLTT